MGLTGKLALVTGAGSGIGRAVCQVLARENARVIASDINLAACHETIKLIKQNEHLAVESDVSKSESVKSAFTKIQDEYLRSPDIVINSAGITKDGWLLRMKEKDFDQVIDINLKGTFLVSQTAAALMKEGNIKGSIVNIASIVGKTGNMGQANYSASKAGVIGFTKTAAKELGQFGIRVNVILPGFIKTPMTDVVPDKIKAQLIPRIPLGRLGDPTEIAEVAAFLASEKSSLMTGAILEVTGGLDM
eukprot:TRINITY_DN7873_c0_g1_i2.p1 TRINITY_DN7873_c0_g1~~TRINITY_DN7873_c0_g1_i2.p1  ORF type:complete len:247 (-),score=43.31 TRINITY_DN7873_c0_g1_i2:197-937(-)